MHAENSTALFCCARELNSIVVAVLNWVSSSSHYLLLFAPQHFTLLDCPLFLSTLKLCLCMSLLSLLILGHF